MSHIASSRNVFSHIASSRNVFSHIASSRNVFSHIASFCNAFYCCSIKPPMWTIVLLICSNIFMTIAWYGHLKFENQPLWRVILVSWGIAFFEYCFQVPANRIGYGRFTPVQLKVIQEIITLTVFGVFATFYFGSHLRWNHAVAGVLLVGAAFFMFHKF